MSEPAGLVRIRQHATDGVDAEFDAVLKQISQRSVSEVSASQILRRVEMLSENLTALHSRQLERVISNAYQYGHREGFREAGSLYIVNQAAPAYVENTIKDLWRKAAEKTKSAFGRLSDVVKQAIRKVAPKKKPDEPLTAKEVRAVQDITAETVKKMKRLAKTQAQDEVTRAAAEGKLDAYAGVGISSVMVQIETVKDNRRCAKCAELEGLVLPIEQARALLPVHPHCRCLWKLPRPKQKGAKKAIVLEQKRQEYKVMKLRERLDRRYKQKQAEKEAKKAGKGRKRSTKAVHNEENRTFESVFNSLCDFERQPGFYSVYADFEVDSYLSGSIHLLLKDITGREEPKSKRLAAKTSYGTCVGVNNVRPKTGKSRVVFTEEQVKLCEKSQGGRPILPAGLMLRVEWHNAKTGETEYRAVGDSSGRFTPYCCSGDGVCVAYEYRRNIKCGTEQTVPLIPDSIREYPYRLARDVNGTVSVVMVNPKKGFIDAGISRTPLLDFENLLDFIVKNALIVA